MQNELALNKEITIKMLSENVQNKMKNIEEVNLNFMMEKLSIEFKVSTDEDVEEIMDEVRKLVKKLEPDAVIS